MNKIYLVLSSIENGVLKKLTEVEYEANDLSELNTRCKYYNTVSLKAGGVTRMNTRIEYH